MLYFSKNIHFDKIQDVIGSKDFQLTFEGEKKAVSTLVVNLDS